MTPVKLIWKPQKQPQEKMNPEPIKTNWEVDPSFDICKEYQEKASLRTYLVDKIQESIDNDILELMLKYNNGTLQ